MKRFSDFKKGDMFFFNSLNLDFMQPEVYVMVDESIVQDTNTKSFIENSALVKHLISNYEPSTSDIWAITERYFNSMQDKGHFIPIDDIREAEDICEKFGLKMEEVL